MKLWGGRFTGEENELDMKEIKQIGGHASIGYGFTQFIKLN